MNALVLRLTSLLLAVIPMMAAAQTNIRQAFDAIINCPEAQVTESHTLDRDPATKAKTGQSDVYDFVLPAGKIKLVKNVLSAFTKDSETAYSLNSGKAGAEKSDISLAVGDGTLSGISINDINGEYIYALFLAPLTEDPNGIYRYAYSLSFKEKDGKVAGRLAITYATTLKHRQQLAEERQYKVLRSFSGGETFNVPVSTSKTSWFETLMSYLQGMTQAGRQTRISLATKAYTHITNLPKYPDVTETDKNSAREILRAMISDNKKYSDPMLNKLLQQCLAAIK